MTDRFKMRRASRGMLAGPQPLIDRALDLAGGRQMMGKEFGLALDEIGEMLLQHHRDAGVQFLPPDAQQCAVGRVLHQRVLEEVRGLRRDAAAEQEPGLGEPVEAQSKLGGGPLRHMLDQVVAELAAYDRADLADLLCDGPQPIEAGDQRGVQGGWYHRGDPVVAIAAFEHRFGQLFDEQRDTVGAVEYLVNGLVGEAGIAGESLDQAAPSRAASRFRASIVTCG